jgi:hypothetical protein
MIANIYMALVCQEKTTPIDRQEAGSAVESGQFCTPSRADPLSA